MEHLPQDYKTLDTYSGSSVLLWQELILFVWLCTFLSFSLRRMTVYSSRAPNTKIMHAMTQHSIAVRPSAWKGNIDVFSVTFITIIRGCYQSFNTVRVICSIYCHILGATWRKCLLLGIIYTTFSQFLIIFYANWHFVNIYHGMTMKTEIYLSEII